MIAGECQSLIAGHCVDVAPVRVIMATVLGAAAALTLHEWYLEVTG